MSETRGLVYQKRPEKKFLLQNLIFIGGILGRTPGGVGGGGACFPDRLRTPGLTRRSGGCCLAVVDDVPLHRCRCPR